MASNSKKQIEVVLFNNYDCNFDEYKQDYIENNYDELGEPLAAWLEDANGRKKWDYRIVDDGAGQFTLIAGDCIRQGSFYKAIH